MKESINKKIIFFVFIGTLLISVIFLSMISTRADFESNKEKFFLPSCGGGMIHCDLQMSENIRLPIPTEDADVVWYSHKLGGELFGTWGNGIAGNGRIAACSFSNYFGKDNLILYDYHGNHIWSSGFMLNFLATASTPMIDTYDRVVACDNQKIIMVDASDHNDVHVEWNTTIRYHDERGLYPIPYSPTIVENNTIILPMQGGPLLAFNISTGEKIAELKLGQNETNISYYGIPDMPMEDFMSIIKNPLDCPYHYNTLKNMVEWISNITYGIMPLNYVFQDGNIAFINSPDGNVSAFNITDGKKLVSNSIIEPQLIQGSDYYSTINSACVKGNRIFLACEKKGNKTGRLYAVDVNLNAVNESDLFQVAWSYSYFGKSQASPTLIDDTIYFDGYNSSFLSRELRDPHIYAVYTNGTEKWKISYPNMTWFSFAMDPRGGFWYEDCDQVQLGSNTGGNKLVHFSEENGSIIEEIDIKTLLNDTGKNKDLPVIPSSCMTTCGTATNPIMLISANHQWFHDGKWVIAINLSDNNSVLWKIKLPFLNPLNYANGQYTILMENNESRILFGTWLGGVMAIGAKPCPIIIIVIISIISIVLIAFILWIVLTKGKRISVKRKKD